MSEESTSPALLACVRDAREAVGKSAAAEPVFLAPDHKQAALRELAPLETQVAAVRLRVMATAPDVSAEAIPESADWSGS